jgi:hypothetical protein
MATRYRDLQRPTLLQDGIVDNSAEQKAMALASAFKGLERASSGILGDLNAVQGAQVGAAEGAAGAPQPKTGWRALTRYGNAYNSAAEVTYSNKLQTDIHERMSQIELESEANPVKFQELSKAHRDELLKTVPPEYAPRIGQIMDARIAAGNVRVGEQAIQLERRTGLASYLESAPARIAATLEAIKGLSPEDGDAAIAETIAENERQLEAFGWMDPVDKVKLRESFVKDFDAAVADQEISTEVDEIGRIARTDVFEADKMLAALEGREDLAPEIKNEIRQRVQQQRNLLEAERSALHYQDVAGLTQRLSRDEYGVGVEREADRLYRLGAIGPGEYRGYMGRSAENADRVIKAKATADAAAQVIYGGGKLYPGNADHRKAVSAAFDEEVARLGVTPGDDRWTQMTLAMTRESNILPDSAKEWIGTALISGDPGLASRAAGVLSGLQRDNPGAFEWQQEPKLAALSNLMMRNQAAGLSVERAYEMAYKDVYEVSPQEKDLRNAEYTAQLKDDPHDPYLKDAFTREVDWGFDKKPPPAPAALRAEHDSLTRQFYNDSGDLKTARELATAQVKARWGVTEVNGVPEFTRYPIEQTYGFPAEFIRNDLAAQLQGVTDRPARLVQNRNTNSTRGLEWGVEVLNEDGAWDVLRGPDNRAARYTLPLSSKEFDDFAERNAAAAAEKLRRERAEAAARDAVRSDAMRQMPTEFVK